MMRSPQAMAIAVRRPSGEVVVKEEPWRSIWRRFKFLRWPFLRGGVVFAEALINGLQALTFSANEALAEEKDGGPLSPWAMAGTIGLALSLGILVFVVAPHVLTIFLGRIFDSGFGVRSFWFHAIDGLIKVIFFVAYIGGISLIKDVRRVFMYHGAEHMGIHAYEHGEDLTVANARRHPTLHPRCGTAFLLLVLVISIGFFAAAFPLLPKPAESAWLSNAFYILVKIALMPAIAGVAYEITRLAGRHPDNPWVRPVIWPGLMLQKLTTRPPTDDQIEIALTAIRCALKIEEAA